MSEQQDAGVTYISPSAPSLTIRLATGVKKFKHGTLTLFGADAEQLDDALRDPEKPHLSALIKKLDRDRALKISQEFLAQEKRRHTAAKDGFSSDTIHQLTKEALEAQDKQLSNMSPEEIAEMHKQMGEKFVPTEPVQPVNASVVEEPAPPPPEQVIPQHTHEVQPTPPETQPNHPTPSDGMNAADAIANMLGKR